MIRYYLLCNCILTTNFGDFRDDSDDTTYALDKTLVAARMYERFRPISSPPSWEDLMTTWHDRTSRCRTPPRTVTVYFQAA